MQKILLLSFVLTVLLPFTSAATDTNGFLVFQIDRYSYQAGGHGTEVKQKFKIPLTEEFLKNFKHLPSQNSSGTGFYCGGGNLNNHDGSTRFTWWINKTDGRWWIHMWGEGVETIDGSKISSMNPTSTQSLGVKNLEDMDMSYQLSYVHMYDGLNVEFSAKYVAAKDINANGPIPDAPVNKADRSPLFKGDDLTHLPITIHCSFQEG